MLISQPSDAAGLPFAATAYTMTHQLVVTAVGPDRRGLVGEFAGHVQAAGANIADSRMVNLGGHFALVALVSGSPEVLERTRTSLRNAAPQMQLAVVFADAPAAERPLGVPFRLKTYSMDQPGIVHGVTSFLHERGINIEELETHLDSAPFMGTPLFTMDITMTVPSSVALRPLRHALEELGERLNCDIDLEPV